MHTAQIVVDGTTYEIEYDIDGDDELTCYMPDGSPRSTTLRGLKPEHAIAPHLRSYLKQATKPR